jgi:MOSC domain-containing protein YiiM
MTTAIAIRIRQLYVSPGHNFFGRHGQPAGEHPAIERETIECVAGKGIVDDRFFNFKPGYDGQITFFAWEVYEDLCRELDVRDKAPSVFRRNVITQGVDLNEWIAQEFEIQGVRFGGVEECKPCHWMNLAFGAGAEARLRGRGGLRAVILSDGRLHADFR